MTVYVCPSRDIECGQDPKRWCHTCPQLGPYIAPRYDIERMKRALAGPSITLPDDLKTPEEISAFIRGAAAALSEVEQGSKTP